MLFLWTHLPQRNALLHCYTSHRYVSLEGCVELAVQLPSGAIVRYVVGTAQH
jgi:hypothetical protein